MWAAQDYFRAESAPLLSHKLPFSRTSHSDPRSQTRTMPTCPELLHHPQLDFTAGSGWPRDLAEGIFRSDIWTSVFSLLFSPVAAGGAEGAAETRWAAGGRLSAAEFRINLTSSRDELQVGIIRCWQRLKQVEGTQPASESDFKII